MVAPAMVSFEGLMSERMLKHKARFDLLSGIAKWLPYLLGLYLLIKIGDLVVRNAITAAFTISPQSISWWLEMLIGVVTPLILFVSPKIVKTRKGLLWGSTLVIIGLVWNRLNVAVVGMKVENWETYYPFWTEIFITIGVIAIGLIVFKWAVENLPIYEHETATAL
jgi:formate dehydrogenase iron-sulfur subunit